MSWVPILVKSKARSEVTASLNSVPVRSQPVQLPWIWLQQDLGWDDRTAETDDLSVWTFHDSGSGSVISMPLFPDWFLVLSTVLDVQFECPNFDL